MRHPTAQNRGDPQEGSVLVLALLVTLIILAIGLTAMWLSSSSMKMSGNIARRQEALYAAEAGLDFARHVLHTAAKWTPMMDGSCTATKHEPTGKGNVFCTKKNNKALEDISLFYDPDTKSSDSPATLAKAKWMAKLRYTVYIRNDDAEIQGGQFLRNRDNDWRVILRSEGTGRDQLSFFAIEAVVSRAAATMDEDSYSQLGGSAQNMNSKDGVVPLGKKVP